jgi:hypothetical protein
MIKKTLILPKTIEAEVNQLFVKSSVGTPNIKSATISYNQAKNFIDPCIIELGKSDVTFPYHLKKFKMWSKNSPALSHREGLFAPSEFSNPVSKKKIDDNPNV